MLHDRTLRVLMTFSKPDIQRKMDLLRETCEGKVKLEMFADSGAYSAHTQGKEIKIDDYIQFVYDNLPHLTAYANLDVIGEAQASYDNQMIMESTGLSPVPVIHYATSMELAELYGRHYDYVALGGPVASKTAPFIQWTSLCFGVLQRVNPSIRIHGFGITTPWLVLRFPYYSVDSSSWLARRFGHIRLFDPVAKKMSRFQRENVFDDRFAYDYLRCLLPTYGLTVGDFLHRRKIYEFDRASVKSFGLYEDMVLDELGRHSRVFLADFGPDEITRTDDFFDFVFDQPVNLRGLHGFYSKRGIKERIRREASWWRDQNGAAGGDRGEPVEPE